MVNRNRKIAHKSLVKKILTYSNLNPDLPNHKQSIERCVKHLREDRGKKYRVGLKIVKLVRGAHSYRRMGRPFKKVRSFV